MSPSAPFVRAIVVTTGRPEFLRHAVTALTAQDHPIDAWHVVSTSADPAAARLPDGIDIPVTTVRAAGFGAAVDALLAQHEAEDEEWLWLVHDDAAPDDGALTKLTAAVRKRRRAGIVGAVTTRFDDPKRVVNTGVTVSRIGARRVGVADADDLDQGQHDAREDALAVSLAGALVKRSVWEGLGGTDPAYGAFGSGLDLCRRCWRAGHDVVVVPGARVRHAQAGLYGRATPDQEDSDHRRTYAARRASEWYHALAWSPVWVGPLLLLWVLGSSVARAAYRLASTEVRMVGAELRVPLVLAARLSRLPASRKRIAAAGKEPVERPLLASWLDVFSHIRARELGAYESWRAESRPSEVQTRELRTLALRRRWTLFGLTGALAAISFALYGTWLSRVIDGQMLTGDALGATNVSVSELWQRTWTGWSDVGLGAAALDGGWSAMMIPLAALPGGLAGGVGLLLMFAPLWAGLAAWFGAGAVSRTVTARALAAVAWSVWPPFLQSVVDGRIGAVIAHVMLPVFAAVLARAVSAQRRDRLGDGTEFPTTRVGSPAAGTAAGIAMTVITVAVPALLVPLVAIVVAVAVIARGKRRIASLVLVVPVIVAGPGLAAAWQERSGEWLSVLLREPGPSAASAATDPARLLLGGIQAPPAWPQLSASGNILLAYLAGVALVAVALAALASRTHVALVRAGWLVAAAGLAVAALSHRTLAAPAGLDGAVSANGWPAPGLSLMALGLLVAALAGVRAGFDATGHTVAQLAAIRRANVASAVAVSVVLAAHVAGAAWPGRDFGGDVHPAAPTVVPLVAALESESAPHSRVLVLRDGAAGVEYVVLTRDGSTAMLGRGFLGSTGDVRGFAIPDSAAARPADAVGVLAAAGDGAADALAEFGIGAVVVPPGSDDVAAALLRGGGLTLMGSSERGLTWRVGEGAGSDASTRASRAWLESAEGRLESLDSSPTSLSVTIQDGPADRTVVLSTFARDGWTATLDGVTLERVDRDVLVAFAVGADGGKLEVEFVDDRYRRWWWAAVIALAWTIFNAIPIRDRRFQGVGR